jgi:hypothetical protein
MNKQKVGEGWVILRDPKHVAERHRRPIIAKATSMQRAAEKVTSEIEQGDGISEEEFLSLYAFNDLVAVALIASWSWKQDVTIDGLLDLPAKDYDQILKITAPLVTQLMPSFEPDVEENDPQSPFVFSGE